MSLISAVVEKRLKNYYAILESPVGCSLEEIRQAYHRLVQEHLDDEAVFADLKEAYEVLSTPSRRAEYDRTAWGETFDPSSPPATFAASGAAPSGRCPMGAEAQCPVLQDRVAPTDTYCPECGYGLAGLNSGAAFDLTNQPDPQTQARLEEQNGRIHALRSGSNLVGRENADVLISDKTLSRRHARLELADSGSVMVEDLGSTNGTQVNDEPLTPNVLRSLADGDRLRFGSVFFVLHLPQAGAAPAPETVSSSEASEALTTPAEVRGQVTDLGEGSVRNFPLPAGITTFGRRPENTVVLAGDPYVSGSHAQIRADGDVFILTDTGSTNGTLLNGERLKINTPVSLDSGDVIVIGGTSLRFDRLGPGAESAEEADAENLESEDLEEDETAPAEIQSEAAPEDAEG